ncbi:MAG: amidohydrolase [Planctomycetaceae bacterium]|nr:amidohydrolase [Planctomycetaceae bacterium]
MDRRTFLGISALLLPSLALAQRRLGATSIFHNGNVLTVDPNFRRVEAFAVSGDNIVATGTNAEMLALARDNTQTIDLQGKTVLPGIVDSHSHPVSAAMYELDHEIPTMETIADVLAYFRSRTTVVPKGEWIGLQQVFITRLREKRYPTRAELDAVMPDHPAFMRTGPDAMVNSLALAKLGITRNSGDHDGKHGVIFRDPQTQEPTGILRNCNSVGHFLVTNTGGVTQETRKARLKQQMTAYNSVGITTVSDRNASTSDLALYSALKNDGNLTCRIHAFGAVGGASPDEIEARVKAIAATPFAKKDNMLWCGGVKMFLDGGMLTGSARMVKPWGPSPIYGITDPEYLGLLFLSKEQVVAFTSAAAMNDMQPALHCVGDGALEFLLDAFSSSATAVGDGKVQSVRPSICHGNFMLPDKLETIKRLGAVVDMQPAWLYLDGATLFDHFGEERMRWFQPYRTLLDNKVPIGGGSDHMLKIEAHRAINLYCPFLGMWTTLTRSPRWSERILTPEQKITREEAIRFYTIDSAYSIRCEEDRGSIEPGKLADFIVLDRDIMRCPVDDIRETKVLETWLGGRRNWRHEET